MNSIDIPWNTRYVRDTSMQALEISRWLTDHGLTSMKDYVWHIDSSREMLRITFIGNEAASYIPLFLLKWTKQ